MPTKIAASSSVKLKLHEQMSDLVERKKNKPASTAKKREARDKKSGVTPTKIKNLATFLVALHFST
jgi:hypothetical protein